MKIKMQLVSDVIFGNGMSVPGGEDISVLHDKDGFPYYKGGTFKGLLREEYERYLGWMDKKPKEVNEEIFRLFGKGGSDLDEGKLVFSDFTLSPYVKSEILKTVGENQPDTVLNILTNIYTFTSISEAGVAKEGGLRMARSVDKGLCFYSEVQCGDEDKDILLEVIRSVKWIGSMRNRGFGKVEFSEEK